MDDSNNLPTTEVEITTVEKLILQWDRNFVALIAGYKHKNEVLDHHPVGLFTVPLYYLFGFFMLMRSLALGQTMVLMGGRPFDFERMLVDVERCRVTYIPVSPPLVVAMVKSDVVGGGFDLSSLWNVAYGRAPLGKEVSERFIARFPHVQGYELTKSTGAASDSSGPDERVFSSANRLSGPDLHPRCSTRQPQIRSLQDEAYAIDWSEVIPGRLVSGCRFWINKTDSSRRYDTSNSILDLFASCRISHMPPESMISLSTTICSKGAKCDSCLFRLQYALKGFCIRIPVEEQKKHRVKQMTDASRNFESLKRVITRDDSC